MKTLILSLLLLSFSGMANAQAGAWATYVPPVERAKTQTEQLKKELQLNDSQAKKVYTINLKINQKYDEVNSGGHTDYQYAINKIGNERDALMEDVLNGKQYLKYIRIR